MKSGKTSYSKLKMYDTSPLKMLRLKYKIVYNNILFYINQRKTKLNLSDV